MTIVVRTCVANRQFLRYTGFPDIDYAPAVPPPTAPTASPVTSFGSTTATLPWTEVNDSTVTGHNVYISTIIGSVGTKQSTLPASARSASLANLSPSTTYYLRVSRTNDGGESPLSNQVSVTTTQGGTLPPAPTLAAAATNRTNTSFTVPWTEGAGAGTLTGHWVYVNSVKRTDLVIGGSATSALVNGLQPGTSYSIQVASVNAAGEGPKSAPATYSTTGTQSLTIQIGITAKTDPENHGGQWRGLRIYQRGSIDSSIEQYIGTNRVNTACGYTSDDLAPGATPNAIETAALAALNAFYNGTTNRDNVEFQMAIGNEIDRTFGGGALTAAQRTTLANNYERLSDVVYSTTGGTRDWPMASVWIDLTTRWIQAGSGPTYLGATSSSGLTVASRLKRGSGDGMASSIYPALRALPYPTIALGANVASGHRGRSMEHYDAYVTPVFQLAIDFGITNVGCWETGMNVNRDNFDTATWSNLQSTYPFRSSGSTAKVWDSLATYPSRPFYAEKMVWFALQYALDHGLTVKQWLYWNSEGDGGDYLKYDTTAASPNTRDKWFNAPSTFVAA